MGKILVKLAQCGDGKYITYTRSLDEGYFRHAICHAAAAVSQSGLQRRDLHRVPKN